MQYDLAVCVPSRNEDMLNRTIQDILENIEAKTQLIVVLDGWLVNPPLTYNDSRLTLIYNPVSKGQRGATNQAAKISDAKYIMKCDSHVTFDKGFDRKMLEAFKKLDDNVTMIPVMKNLHAYDWLCENGHRRYQGKSGVCTECGKETHQDMIWKVKESPARFTFTVDRSPHFQYWSELAKRPENIKGTLTNTGVYDTNLRETFSIQGSCFMLSKERYFALDICSEDFHSWGMQGYEVAMKTWLSGGRVIANLNTFFGHLFRTNNFGGFPYSNPQSLVEENRELSKKLFINNEWPLATRTYESLLEQFNPPGWEDYKVSKPTKSIIFYTDSLLDEKIAKPVRDRLQKISEVTHIPIVSASLKKLDFGKNIRFPSLRRSPQAMFKQILGALENSTADYIFFCEHDVLYSPTHFDFTPLDKNIFYFNNNVWKVDVLTGHAVKVDKCEQLSGICVYRETALNWVREKLKQLETGGFDGHYEPQQIVRGGWLSAEPNIDIRHNTNLTPSRWSKEQFKNQDNTIGWQEKEMPEIVKLFVL